MGNLGGWPMLLTSLTEQHSGCPVLASFARAGTVLPIPWGCGRRSHDSRPFTLKVLDSESL